MQKYISIKQYIIFLSMKRVNGISKNMYENTIFLFKEKTTTE